MFFNINVSWNPAFSWTFLETLGHDPVKVHQCQQYSRLLSTLITSFTHQCRCASHPHTITITSMYINIHSSCAPGLMCTTINITQVHQWRHQCYQLSYTLNLGCRHRMSKTMSIHVRACSFLPLWVCITGNVLKSQVPPAVTNCNESIIINWVQIST